MPDRTSSVRFLLLLVASLAISGGGRDLMTPAPEIGTSLEPHVTVRAGSAEQHARLSVALDRFAAAGLPLPDLRVVFSESAEACAGHLGLMDSSTEPWTVSICSDLGFVYEHELAHAWERATLDDDRRGAFMELMGLSTWADPDVDRDARGEERAAFVIQQGVSGVKLPPVIPSRIRRELAAFELLTGGVAPRLAQWLENHNVECGKRPTARSRVLPDRARQLCPPQQPHQALVAWALGRFDLAGLDLPELTIDFHDDKASCSGHSGLYRAGPPAQIHLCIGEGRPETVWKNTILHELAHAWAEVRPDPATRAAFLTARGLASWHNPELPPHRWGAEHAAEVISWALMDKPVSVVRVDNAEPAALTEAFRVLTGTDPVTPAAAATSDR